MQINLPSTLTHNRAWSLFFLTLFHLEQTEAGNAFKNCLAAENNDLTSYDKLLNYPFPPGDLGVTPDYRLSLCCDGSQCQPGYSSICVSEFYCVMIGGNVACDYYRSSKCQGIIGNEPITVNNVNRRDDNYCANSTVSLVSPLTNNCFKTITPIGLEQGYAHYNTTSCSDSVRGGLLYCGWDNQGMFCTSGSYCWLQFPLAWPGLAAKNPTLTQITTAAILPAPTGSTTIPTSDNQIDNHLVEKIAIPVGSVTGTGIISLLTYYFCKKRKNRKQLMLKDSNIELTAQSSFNDNSELKSNFVSNYSELEHNSVLPEQNSNFVQSEQNDLSFAPSEQNDLSFVSSDQKIEFEENDKLEISTPLISSSSHQVTTINQLRTKLIGSEQLWTNYLDVNNLVINNPTSHFAQSQLNSLQQQLLQILTMSEIGLLLEANHNYPVSQQTEYSEIIEEVRNPQWINARNPEWRG